MFVINHVLRCRVEESLHLEFVLALIPCSSKEFVFLYTMKDHSYHVSLYEAEVAKQYFYILIDFLFNSSTNKFQ